MVFRNLFDSCTRQVKISVHLAEQALQHRPWTYLDDRTHASSKDVVHGLRPHDGRGQLGDEVFLDDL